MNEPVRIESFAKLLETLIQPLTEKEQELARFQYNLLLARVNTVLNEDSKLSSKPQPLQSIIYRLCTSKELYKGCELAIAVMLYNIGCTTSECGMESLISAIGENNNVNRPLSIHQLQKEMIIRTNGPHPLHPTTMKLLETALHAHFGGGPEKWTFTKGTSSTETSRVISRHIKSLPESKLS